MLFSRLKFVRIRVGLAALENTEFPSMLGSTLRGTFGHSFKKASCVMHHGNCAKCLVSSSCPYFSVFESKNSEPKISGMDAPPHPYNILPPLKNIYLKDEILYFQFTLFGEHILSLPYIIYSFQIMGRLGLGKGRKQFELVSVQDFYTGTEALKGQGVQMERILTRDLGECSSSDLNSESRILISFLTPLRILRNGKILRSIDNETFQQNIRRRYKIMTSLYGYFSEEDISEVDRMEFTEIESEYRRWKRYSSRQRTSVRQDGILGRWIISPNSEKNHALLKAYRVLYLGKSNSFGLGKFLMRELSPAARVV